MINIYPSDNIQKNTKKVCNIWKAKLELCYKRNNNNKFEK